MVSRRQTALIFSLTCAALTVALPDRPAFAEANKHGSNGSGQTSKAVIIGEPVDLLVGGGCRRMKEVRSRYLPGPGYMDEDAAQAEEKAKAKRDAEAKAAAEGPAEAEPPPTWSSPVRKVMSMLPFGKKEAPPAEAKADSKTDAKADAKTESKAGGDSKAAATGSGGKGESAASAGHSSSTAGSVRTASATALSGQKSTGEDADTSAVASADPALPGTPTRPVASLRMKSLFQ